MLELGGGHGQRSKNLTEWQKFLCAVNNDSVPRLMVQYYHQPRELIKLMTKFPSQLCPMKLRDFRYTNFHWTGLANAIGPISNRRLMVAQFLLGVIMTRAALHVTIQSICCSKVKGVDHDGGVQESDDKSVCPQSDTESGSV